MKHRGRAAAILLLVLWAGCLSLSRKADIVSAKVHPVALEGDEYEDLEFLRSFLEGKWIVQLGENTHGVREYNLAKARIVRYLHEELGYGVLAFESPLYQCYDADRQAAESPAISTLTRCAYGVWHTEEVRHLFDYLRETHQSGRPLRLAGIDIQPIGTNKAGRPGFLAEAVSRIDSVFAAAAFSLDSTFLEIYARGGRARRAFFRSDEGRRMAQEYERLASLLDRGGQHEHVKVAGRTARSMAAYIRQQSAPTTHEYIERRDIGMAENLIFLLEELYADEKVIVWGHNFHLRHNNLAIPADSTMFPDVSARTMGRWVRERYGERVYTIGLYTYSGRAADNSGDVYEIEPPAAGSMEAILSRLHPGPFFIDLSQAPQTAWIDTPVTARYNATVPLRMILRHQYDALLFIPSATPPVMLY